jgi:hypothetical protein
MSDIGRVREALVARILEGDGTASRAQRRAAFDDAGLTGAVGVLVEKVCKRAHEVTDDDVAAACASGLGEDEVFEIVVCAAVGEATRQVESALAALRAASGEG